MAAARIALHHQDDTSTDVHNLHSCFKQWQIRDALLLSEPQIKGHTCWETYKHTHPWHEHKLVADNSQVQARQYCLTSSHAT